MTSVPRQFNIHWNTDLDQLIWLCVVFVALFVYLAHEALNISPVPRHRGLLNANVCSVAEQRQLLSVELVAWGVTLLECSHARRSSVGLSGLQL